MPGETTPLCRQTHFLEKCGVSWVVSEAFEQRIGLDRRQSRVSLFVGALQPFKRLVGLSTKGIHLSDLIGPISVMLSDKVRQSSVRVLLAAERVISHHLAGDSPSIECLLLNLC